jgi:hypothetical protein
MTTQGYKSAASSGRGFPLKTSHGDPPNALGIFAHRAKLGK